jgi:hypothetical protein
LAIDGFRLAVRKIVGRAGREPVSSFRCPLTDPTSLIAYRLANRDSSLLTKPARGAASKAQPISSGIVAMGFALAMIIAFIVLAL